MTTAPSIDTLCEGCGKQLRVAAEHAGKQARCPHCQRVYTVPMQSSVTSAGFERLLPAAATGDTWQMKSPEGLVYGPVSKAELDRWRDEGRITHGSQILPRNGQQWLWATDVYPELALARPMSPVKSPFASSSDETSRQRLHPFYANDIQPHRAVLVLVAAIIGMATMCAVPSMLALVLGIYDLRLMKAGKMDRSGRGMTIAGVVLGAVWTLAYLGLLIGVLAMWVAF